MSYPMQQIDKLTSKALHQTEGKVERKSVKQLARALLRKGMRQARGLNPDADPTEFALEFDLDENPLNWPAQAKEQFKTWKGKAQEVVGGFLNPDPMLYEPGK